MKGEPPNVCHFAQVIDVKRQIAATSKLNFFNLRFRFVGVALDDTTAISALGMEGDLKFTVDNQVARTSRVYFKDPENRSILRDFPIAQFPTFQAVIRTFPPTDDLIAGFEISGDSPAVNL
jgi:hypothetical protein